MNGEYLNPLSGFFGAADNALACRTSPPLFIHLIRVDFFATPQRNFAGAKDETHNLLMKWKGSSLGISLGYLIGGLYR
jgi:hypothetical protein